MLTTSFIVGLLAFLSLAMSFYHLPPRLQLWFLQHPLLTDILGMGLIWGIITTVSNTLIAFIAGFFAEIFIFLSFKFFGDKMKKKLEQELIGKPSLMDKIKLQILNKQ